MKSRKEKGCRTDGRHVACFKRHYISAYLWGLEMLEEMREDGVPGLQGHLFFRDGKKDCQDVGRLLGCSWRSFCRIDSVFCGAEGKMLAESKGDAETSSLR